MVTRCARAPCEPPSYAPRDHVTPWMTQLLDTDTTAGLGGSRVMLLEFTGDALPGRCCCYLYTVHRLLIIPEKSWPAMTVETLGFPAVERSLGNTA